VRGDERAAAEWRDFEQATKGARMIEMDERAAYYAELTKAARARLENEPDVEPDRVVTIIVDSTELGVLRAASRRAPGYIGALMLRMLATDDPRGTFERCLQEALVLIRSPWRSHHASRLEGAFSSTRLANAEP
jgi:hypothetical protein